MSVQRRQIEYLNRVVSLVDSLKDVLPPERHEASIRLIGFGEPGEGLLELMWAIVANGIRIGRPQFLEILELSRGLVQPEHVPPGFDESVVIGDG